VLKSAREEHRPPALAVVAAELEVVLLPRHARDDVADPTPGVEASVEELRRRLTLLEGEEAEGGAECQDAIRHLNRTPSDGLY
jgi:hypothetical protein